jgi:phosphoglycerate dehydrogenase-like enzyme
MKILLLDDDHAAYRALLSDRLPSAQLVATASVDEAVAERDGCEIWFGQPDLLVELLRLVSTPKWVQSSWAGYERFQAPDLPKDYLLTRAVGVFGQLMAEYVLSYMLARERQHRARRDAQGRGEWDRRVPGSLADRRVLIVGCGDIGTTVARFLAPFGCKLTGVARRPRQLEPFGAVLGLDQLPSLVENADYVVNLLPDGPETRGLFEAGLFGRFNRQAMFINAGRGSAVVEEDLAAALADGRISEAVLDVCRQEPLGQDSPLWAMDGVSLTGHTAAPSFPSALAGLFLANLERFLAGQPLEGRVDLVAL